MQHRSGIFITFEGTEGAGKSTLIRGLSRKFRTQKQPVLVTREPGGPPLSEKIRNLIIRWPMNPWTELFLYEASRAEHVAKFIQPALRNKKVVLCDRFADSSLAYQAAARGISWKSVLQLNRFAIQGVEPDLTVWLDLPPKLGLSRAKSKNRFEEEGVAFQKRVRQGFLKAKKERPQKWFQVQVTRYSPSELVDHVYFEVLRRFGKRLKGFHGKKNV